MKLRKIAIQEINEQSPKIISKLAKALRRTEKTVKHYIETNNDNLTKAAALIVIQRETGLQDEQILRTRPARKKDKSTLTIFIL